MSGSFQIGDALTLARGLPAESVDCIVTSPPYWGLRSYLPGDDPSKPMEMGAEPTLAEYVELLVALFRELRRALKPEGTCWLNLGDSYASSPSSGGVQSSRMTGGEHKRTPQDRQYKRPDGLKPKDLCLVPYRVALALQDDGWWLRSNIVWHKPNPMPESITDRPTCAHEAVFLLTRSERYWYDADAVKEPTTWVVGEDRKLSGDYSTASGRHDGGRHRSGGFVTGDTRNKRNVWTIPTNPYQGSHYAVMPPALVGPCIKAGCPPKGLVLDPFGGSGTVGMVAQALGRRWLMFDLDERNADLMSKRTAQLSLLALTP